MLLAEIDATGRISARDFYLRRIRRLLPAVITLLIVTATASALLWRDDSRPCAAACCPASAT